MKNSIHSTRKALLAAGALSLATLWGGAVSAQPPGAQPPPPGQAPGAQAPGGQPPGAQTPPSQPPAAAAAPAPASSADVDERTLSQFVDAYQDVAEIQKDLMSEMSDVRDRDEANALHEKARGEMLQAVESSDLSVDEFNRIVRGMQQDRQLSDRVQSAMNSTGG